MKKSFILHIDSLGILDELTDEQSGQLFKEIYNYHNPKKPKETQITQVVKLAFYPFKSQFERDLQTYGNVVKRNTNNGKLGGRPKKINPEKPRKADSDSVSDNDSVSKKEKKDITGKPDPNLNFQLKESFCEFYLKKFNTGYVWSQKDWGKTKTLLENLFIKVKEFNPGILKENESIEIIKWFNKMLNGISDKWILDNLSMSIIDSKFNEINNQIPKEEKKQTGKMMMSNIDPLPYKTYKEYSDACYAENKRPCYEELFDQLKYESTKN